MAAVRHLEFAKIAIFGQMSASSHFQVCWQKLLKLDCRRTIHHTTYSDFV